MIPIVNKEAKTKKIYVIRYTKKRRSTLTGVSNYSELMDLLKGSAKGAFIETRMSDNMPLVMHNACADHNTKLKI